MHKVREMDSVLNGFAFVILVMVFLGVLPVLEVAAILLVCYLLLPQLDAISAAF